MKSLKKFKNAGSKRAPHTAWLIHKIGGMKKTTATIPEQSQRQRFIDAARKLGCDEDPAHFDEILKKVARHKPVKAPPKPEQKRQTK
jgi:hypothetical protein